MNLSNYLSEPDALSIADLSAAIGCVPAQVRQWVAAERSANAGRRPGPAFCSAIQTATRRRVMRWDLRPEDWHRIWPEMIGAKGAPEIASEQGA